ncbi:MAG: DJ-1/PfpI family protein [Candidatus Peregrinibacteria bacterium]
MRTVLLIIAQENFQDTELKGTRDSLLKAGFQIVLGSITAGACRGKFGSTEIAEIALKDVILEDYDRVAFIGGPGAEALRVDPSALKIAFDTAAAQKPLGAICIAPLILAKAKVLSGRKATVWDSGGEQAGILTASGATYTGDDVTVDGMIVTANGPAAAEEFGRTLASL